ncbi:MAG: putative Ig domain-containing protein [Candidatus Micrarchaeia archaeon]
MSRLVLLLALSSALALLLLSGCASAPQEGGKPAAAAGDTSAPSGIVFSDDYGNEVSALPAAYAGEQYFSSIYPGAGDYPFECTLAQGSNLPGQLAFASGTCELSGRAPLLSAGSTRAAYPFTFSIRDANGASFGPFTATLEVVPMPPYFGMTNYPGPARIGAPYSHDFCHPASESPLNCGHTPSSDDPSGGVPPYTFTASRLPLGLIMRSDGHLSGTVPKGASTGRQEFEVCAADSTGAEACSNASILLLAPAEKWAGTLSGKNANTADSNLVSAGTSWKYDGTLEFEFPASLVSMMRASEIDIQTGNGTLSGTQTILSQSKFGTGVMKLTGGSVPSTPVEVEAFGGGTRQFIEITAPVGSNFLNGYVETYHNDGALLSRSGFFTDKISLTVTSVTDSTISGTWLFSEQYDTRPRGYGGVYIQTTSFTLNKVE